MSTLLSAVRKVPGGKTVKVEVQVEGGRIKKVVISGDFFAYPPEAVEELERALEGVIAKPEAVRRVVKNFEGRLKIVGASLSDIADLLANLLKAEGSG